MSGWRPAHLAGPMGRAARRSQAAWARCSACDRPLARPVARIARATRTPQSHATFT